MGLLNAINCNKEDLGLGIVDCEQFFQTPKTPIAIRKSWRMLKTAFEALDADGFISLVQQGDWQPIPGAREFTMDIPDPTTQEFAGGVTSVVRNGKPTLRFNYDKGIGFHKVLSSKNSFNAYNIGLTDDAGNLLLAESADGLYVTGIEAGALNTNTYNFKNADTDASTPFWFQLTNEVQFNRRMTMYSTEQSGVDFNETLQPITSTYITGTASAANDVKISVKGYTNRSYGINALDETNFRLVNTVTNAVLPITAVTAGTNEGDYTIEPTTALTAGAKVRVDLYDATATPPVAVALIEDTNQMYKGSSPELTTTA